MATVGATGAGAGGSARRTNRGPAAAAAAVGAVGAAPKSSTATSLAHVQGNANKRAARHRAMQAKAVSGMVQLDSGTRLHIQALAESETSQPGLVCLQKHIHVGRCPPNSSVTARARFYAYKPGVYEVGNVKLSDAEGGGISMKPIRHSVYVHA